MNSEESHPQKSNRINHHKQERKGRAGCISIFLLVFLAGVASEYFGVFNVIPNFGRSGRPKIEFNLWRSGSFPDVSEQFWAYPYIRELAQRRVIQGSPNGKFQPDQPLTRAGFAAMVHAAFAKDAAQPEASFSDVPSTHWAAAAISKGQAAGFFEGFPGKEFRPEQKMTRTEALVALTNGLNLTSTLPPEQPLQAYEDAGQIPAYARGAIAAATEANLVVNHPNRQRLNPNQNATRADAAAFIYQALVHANRAEEIQSEFVVKEGQ